MKYVGNDHLPEGRIQRRREINDVRGHMLLPQQASPVRPLVVLRLPVDEMDQGRVCELDAFLSRYETHMDVGLSVFSCSSKSQAVNNDWTSLSISARHSPW